MLMLWLTDVLRPPPTRVGRITANFALPRAIPAPQFAAALAGGIVGLFAGSLLGGGIGAIGGTLTCAAVSVWLVSARPWRGENIARVGAVRVRAWRAATTTTCPGSALPMARDGRGVDFCGTCGLVCDSNTDSGIRVAALHQWRREFWLGSQRVRPDLREIRIRPGSVAGPAVGGTGETGRS